jgi:transcriptional regulator with XRE-family HTH domain
MKQLRSEKGYSYSDLSELTGLAKSTLQRYETGTTAKIPIDAIESIANALQVSPFDLAGFEYFDLKDNGNLLSNVTKELNEFEPLKLNGLKELQTLEKYIAALGYEIKPASEGAISGISQEESERLAMEADADPNFPCWEVTTKEGNTFTVSLAEHKQLIRRVKNLIASELKIIEENGYYAKEKEKTPGAANTKDQGSLCDH